MQVATYSPQATPQDLPNARVNSIASPELFDAGDRQNAQLGGAIEKAGGVASDIAVDMQHRQNADMIFRAGNQVQSTYAKDYQPQALQKRGAAAEGLGQRTSDWWDKQITENTKNLQNDVQKYLFKEQMMKQRAASVGQMSEHEAQQKYVSLTDSTNAYVQSGTNLAAQSVGTSQQDGIIELQKDQIRRAGEAHAQLMGWKDPQILEQWLRDKNGNLNLQVIQNMARSPNDVTIDGQTMSGPEAAQLYFEKIRSDPTQWDGSRTDQADKLIANGNYLVGAQNAAQAVWESVDENGRRPDEATALEQVRALTRPGKTQLAAEQEISRRYAQERASQREAAHDMDDQGLKHAIATGERPPTDIWSNMSGIGQHNVDQLIKKDTTVVTNWEVYAAQRKLYRDHEDIFRNTEKNHITDLVGVLAPAQMKELIDLQTNPKPAGEETLNNQLRIAYNILGWSEANNRKDMGQFESIARQAIKDEEAASGKKLDDDGRQKIIDNLARDGAVKGGGRIWGDKSEKGFEAYGTADWQKWKPTPDEKLDHIKARSALIASGNKAPSEAQIQATVQRAYEGRKPAPVGTGTVLRDNTPVDHADQVPGQVPAATPEPGSPAELLSIGRPPYEGTGAKIPPPDVPTPARLTSPTQVMPMINERMNPQNEAIVKPLPAGSGVGAPVKLDEGTPPAAAPVQPKVPPGQQSLLQREYLKFRKIFMSPKSSEASKTEAQKQMAMRALQLGATREAVEAAIRRPLSQLGL